MKKAMAMFLCILMMAAFAQTALADSIKLNQQVTLEEECIFTLKSIKAYDVFMNQKSGDSKQWIVATMDVLNLTHDSFFVKAQTDSKVSYDEDFEFENDYLWTNPVGTYLYSGNDAIMYVTGVGETGEISAYYTGDSSMTLSADFANMYVKWSNTYRYDPKNDIWQCVEIWDRRYTSLDSSKTVLDPLVQRTYHYVFLVPDLVAEEEGSRMLYLTVCDNEYEIRF